MKWQPIETAPPDEPVLVFVIGLGDVLLAHKSEDDKRWYGYCGETWLNGRISHWMPLPEAPK